MLGECYAQPNNRFLRVIIMRVVEINVVHNGSTGNIMMNISRILVDKGSEVKTFSTYIKNPSYKHLPTPPPGHQYFGSYVENCIHTIAGQLTGLNGCFSAIGTLKLIKAMKKFRPDVIHLHNLHTFCVNFPMLFKFIKKHNIPVVWTLHDCWSFTGHCAHFVMAGCDKWKTECHDCQQLSCYPRSRIDNTRMAFRLKKKWLLGVKNMTLVAPSRWLAGLVKQSFLNCYPTLVINNGIDLSVFKPTESDFRSRYNIENKNVVLGVVGSWEKRKGIDVFYDLANRLGENYKIVLVGAPASNIKNLPSNVIAIPRTANQTELAEIYTAADVFVNPTREDTYPTVNMEALACGTPVLTFGIGGSPEVIDETCGSVVNVNDVDAMENEIIRICELKPYSMEACIKRSRCFDMNDRFNEYVELYNEVIKL